MSRSPQQQRTRRLRRLQAAIETLRDYEREIVAAKREAPVQQAIEAIEHAIRKERGTGPSEPSKQSSEYSEQSERPNPRQR